MIYLERRLTRIGVRPTPSTLPAEESIKLTDPSPDLRCYTILMPTNLDTGKPFSNVIVVLVFMLAHAIAIGAGPVGQFLAALLALLLRFDSGGIRANPRAKLTY